MGLFNWSATQGVATWDGGTSELTKLTVADLYGLDTDGIADLTRAEAMQIPSVAKIRNRVCAKLGGFPIVVMKGPMLYDARVAWAQSIEAKRTNLVTLSWVTDALIFYGRSFLLIEEKYANGYPRYFKFVPEWQAKVDTAGRLIEAWGKPVAPDGYIRIDAHHEGLLHYGQSALKVSAAVALAAARAADNPVPSIELHQKGGAQLDKEQIDSMISRWVASRRGKNGGVAYTSEAIETKVHGQAAEQLLINAQNLSDINLARAMGAPAWMIDATTNGSSITYGNVNSRSRELVEDTLQPYIDAIMQRFSLDDVLAAGVWARMDSSDLLKDSYATRMTGHKTAIDAGIYDAEEIRKMEMGIPLERAEA